MKLVLVLISALCFSTATFAGPQQEKMKTCNTQAAGKKGDERKAFMKECLSSKGSTSASTSPRERMKDCNVKAKGMKGDERKAFMSSCLKG